MFLILDGMHRRRGPALLEAIYGAVFDELAEHGYAGFSIDRVAERAHTGKASIYRRWPHRAELVAAAVDDALPPVGELPDTGSIRGDLLVLLGGMAASLNERQSAAYRACFSGGEPELIHLIKDRVVPPRRAMMLALLQRAADRGEIRPGAVSQRVAEVGPMMLTGEFMHRGGPIDETTVTAIVDEVMLPLLRP